MDASLTTLIPANAYRRVRWRNDAGWTREIIAAPDDDAISDLPWRWRMSIAEIERDGAFSTFPGVERECMLLRGDGLRLRFGAGATRMLSPPFGRLRFEGERDVDANLVDGRVEVLNLMWKRDRMDAATWHRPLVGSMLVFVDPGSCWLVHVLAGEADLGGRDGGITLSTGDTACLHAGDTRARHVLQGGGELWLARLSAPEC